jgi:hypothetical protein
MMTTTVTYGIGGFDATAMENNVVDVSESPAVVDPAAEARQSAITKLAGWGLSEEEIAAIIG